MPHRIGEDELLSMLRKHSGKAFLVVGHSRAGFSDWADVSDHTAELREYLDAKHGAGSWIAVYGGDRPGRKAGKENIGNVATQLCRAGVTVVAVQSEHIVAKGGVDATSCTHLLSYPTQRGSDGRALFGGVAAPADSKTATEDAAGRGGAGGEAPVGVASQPIGATAIYLGETARSHLGGVVAFGGGHIAVQECQFAVSHQIPFKYYPCRARKCLAQYEPYGELHMWAARVKDTVRAHRRAQAARAAAEAEAEAEAGAGGAGAGSGARLRVPTGLDVGMCLTMHQPWASLLVHGIKRVEGRSWPTEHRGRLWIHAAAKKPTPEDIAHTEQWYRHIYDLDGCTDIQFPKNYPTSCLLGCVDVVGCDSQAAFQARDFRVSLHQESESPFVWLCESPQRLLMPSQMSGQHKLWKLEKKVYEALGTALRSVTAPSPPGFTER